MLLNSHSRLASLELLLKMENVAGMGEIGLDYTGRDQGTYIQYDPLRFFPVLLLILHQVPSENNGPGARSIKL